MMANLRRLYSSLAEDVDPASLPPAAALRQRADRRARVAAVTATVAALVAVGGALIAINVSLEASRAQSPATMAPTTPAVDAPIPDAAFIRAPSNPAVPTAAEGGTFLPELFCGLSPTHETVIARRSRTIPYLVTAGPTPDAWIHQTITTHRPGGAQKFMLQMRTVTEDCTGNPEAGNIVDYRQLPWQPGQGDDYLLVERGTDPTGPPARTISYMVVIRLGDVVTVLNVYGRDGQDADRRVTENFAERATAAIVAWRR
jgi:hypothetical protein